MSVDIATHIAVMQIGLGDKTVEVAATYSRASQVPAPTALVRHRTRQPKWSPSWGWPSGRFMIDPRHSLHRVGIEPVRAGGASG